MARLRSICTAIILGSAITSGSSAAQAASVSLTHTVSVTVPPRVKVSVQGATAPSTGAQTRGQPAAAGLSLSVKATQPWTLSIDAADDSKLQWSRDGRSDFTAITESPFTIATGTLSPVTTLATVFIRSVRDARTQSSADDNSAAQAVLLTIVAQ
jgi:hypothetical protein